MKSYCEKEIILKNVIDGYIPSEEILKLFQDIATDHSSIHGLTYDELLKKNLVWVVLRTKYLVFKKVELNQKVIIRTWLKSKGRLDFNREYRIYDLNGEVIIGGLSKWVLMNFETRRLALHNDLSYVIDESISSLFDDNFSKIESFNIDECEKQEFITSKELLDVNNHVNNTKYSFIIIQALNLDNNITKLQIDYIHEIKQDSKIDIYYKYVDNYLFCKGIINNDVCFEAKLEFPLV